MDGDLLARQVMDTVIGNLARAVKKLAAAGIEHFVITADHGHQFSTRKDDDMQTDNPGGDTLDLHRRCWIGRGGSHPAGTVRVTGAELGYDTDLDFVFPTGLGVFKAGGGLCFHHGGFSLQELVIPVSALRMRRRQADAEAPGSQVCIEAVPDEITNRTFGVKLRVATGDSARRPRPRGAAGRPDRRRRAGRRGGMAVGAELDRATGVVTLHARDRGQRRA